MSDPKQMLRIVEDDRGISGSHLFWWHRQDRKTEAAADADTNLISDAELYSGLRQSYACGKVRRSRDFEMCEALLPVGQTWSAVLARLDSLGVTTLPDESELNPPGSPGLDGFALVVEVRQGNRYRTYSYWSPTSEAAQPEVRTAAAVLRVLVETGYRE